MAVGRAIVRQPAVFLFDEPLSNLDAKLRVQMRAEITGLQRRLGTTTVYVTHDQVEAMTMGHRIALLDRGELQQVGTPLELYEQPANLFVARFIGSPPMNFFPAVIAADGARAEAPGLVFALHGAARAAAAGQDGRRVTVGVRPESLRDRARGDGVPTVPLRLRVEFVETLGHEVHVHGRPAAAAAAVSGGPDSLVAKVDAHRRPDPGDEIDLVLELDHLHLFDAGTECRLPAAS